MPEHIGLHINRLHPTAGNLLEALYATKWEDYNRTEAILSHLLNGEISQRDATVAATIIQWLGTNVGRSFVQEGLRKERFYRCTHHRLDEDGICRECGGDRRGI